ncbi:MAG TPA: hypothetical protein VIY53_10045 [Acidobacteriaceae bacterium]
MDTRILIPIVVVVGSLVAVMVAFTMRRRKSDQQLKQHFGPEFDRTAAQQHGDARRAEATLAKREKRVESFPLRDLSPIDREAYAMEWAAVQRRFFDNPSAVVGTADRLVNCVMIDCGYPMTNFEQRAADISLSYPTVVENYRAAHDIVLRHADGQVTTEEMRQAMVYYRSLFDELLGLGSGSAKVQPINRKRGGVARAS